MSASTLPPPERGSDDPVVKGSVAEAPAPVAPPSDSEVSGFAEAQEFVYRPVPILAPATLFFGLVGGMALLTVVGLVPALLGIVCGLIALWQIGRSDGMLGGKKFALIGTVLSVLFLVGGSALHAYSYATEVPEGFRRLNFSKDISQKKFLIENGRADFHPDVAALDGQRVFLKGFMYPVKQSTGLTRFVMAKDNGDCCFGGQPKLEEMVVVKMAPGVTADYHQTRVSVAGTFRVGKPEHIAGLLSQSGDPRPIYFIEDVEHFELSRTSF